MALTSQHPQLLVKGRRPVDHAAGLAHQPDLQWSLSQQQGQGPAPDAALLDASERCWAGLS